MDNTEKNNTTKNDGYNQSIITKNTLSNNYLMNSNVNNNYTKVLNKEKEVSNQILKHNKKIKVNQLIPKIYFNIFDYLLFTFCGKKNNFLIYRKFRQKIISEEHIIQIYFDMYELLSIDKNHDDSTKLRGKYRLSRILSSVDNKFKFNE